MTQKKQNQVQKKEETSVPANLMERWGDDPVDNEDILLSNILVMQPMSTLVSEEKAHAGDIVKSVVNAVVGGKDNPMPFVPLRTFKSFIVREEVNGRAEFRRIEMQTAANKDAVRDWEENGNPWRRDRVINVYALLVKDIVKSLEVAAEMKKSGSLPDPDDVLLPVLIRFQRTGYGAGKMLTTHFAKANEVGVPPAVSVFGMTTKLTKNDRGAFWVPQVEKMGKTEGSHLVLCKKWYDILGTKQVKIDDSDLHSDEDSESGVNGEEF